MYLPLIFLGLSLLQCREKENNQGRIEKVMMKKRIVATTKKDMIYLEE